ncbi:glyoxalase [Enterococcus sp. JM4C]|uniref:VOC family protein n=1 Tax=Candidatus Enterococcus huntleyi TaxID=1857217 RepID=UPI0013797E69|nr:VOC family protein [Enterococcus sp. JM4C]KAF1297200.1 glyoxalase [Enterococcus sp. JM4C]
MKYKGPMLVVKDIEQSKAFYTKILQVRVISDLGDNATLTGGLSLQTEESWLEFTNCQKDFFSYGGNVAEFYFEEPDFDAFIARIEHEDIEFLGEVATMPWGQKVIRFYDPDKHIIEVGEDLAVMVKRLHNEGLTIDELVKKTYMKKGIIERILK